MTKSRDVIIGVVSDTHSKPLPEEMVKAFEGVDFIIHAGDFCSVEDWKALEKIRPVKGVQGNMDEAPLRKVFPVQQILTVGSHQIGLFHGEGAARGVLASVQRRFCKEDVDVVIFGHSHQAFQETIEGVLYLNPGSPNDEIFAPFRSFGLLRVGKDVSAELIRLND